ncbi:MAG TPA: NAD(P)-binding domain-containing protein [Actinomycetota bacterium]
MSPDDRRPFPPGSYPVVVVGSGPGGLQTSYCLRRLGVDHAVISADEEPGGMFRRFPLFQRLITWTKPYAPVERGTREYERYDWNSLLGDEPAHRAILPPLMDGTSYFPSRPEMEAGIRRFTEVAGVPVRFGCVWERTARDEATGGFVLGTSDGEYRTGVAIFAVGMTEPWTAPIPGLDGATHYVDVRPAAHYVDKRVFVVGKRNSGFEIADGLLPVARQVILGSPRPARLSIMVHSTAAARARYLQPYEDHVLAGGTLVLDVSIDRVERSGDGWRVFAAGTTRPGDFVFDVDEVIAATGFRTPLGDLADLGVAGFFDGGRLPRQTPFWESPTVPGIYFAGNVTQGSIGMKKYGTPSNSAAVHGFRYNARVLAEHVAAKHFGVERERPPVPREELVGYLLQEATTAPELWNQQSYLTRVVESDPAVGPVDGGIAPLEAFVDDRHGVDAVAVAVETDATGDIHPAVYVRRGGRVDEHLLPSDPQHDFTGGDHRAQLESVLGDLAG